MDIDESGIVGVGDLGSDLVVGRLVAGEVVEGELELEEVFVGRVEIVGNGGWDGEGESVGKLVSDLSECGRDRDGGA